MNDVEFIEKPSLEDYIATDEATRIKAKEIIGKL
jgi:hypothetical protein